MEVLVCDRPSYLFIPFLIYERLISPCLILKVGLEDPGGGVENGEVGRQAKPAKNERQVRRNDEEIPLVLCPVAV